MKESNKKLKENNLKLDENLLNIHNKALLSYQAIRNVKIEAFIISNHFYDIYTAFSNKLLQFLRSEWYIKPLNEYSKDIQLSVSAKL